ncbi:YegP family protein [Agromyces sp. NPDC057679]|uniref:YegP family protein n=1 Tax=Agromyces sp. NPDC057679 TaxID=3346207 RepID=UPI00366D425A
MAGTFELYTDASGEYRFRLKASNGQVIAASQGYTTKAAAQNGIDSVRTHATDAELVDQTE